MKNILKNMTLFLDGRGMAGKVEETTLPKLTLKMEEYRAGGMDAPIEIEMGMEKLECSFTLMDYDPDALVLWGVGGVRSIPFTLRGSIKDETTGNERALIVAMRGKIKEVDEGSLKAGENAKLKFTATLDYYKKTIAGRVVQEIDVINMIRVIDGVDVLEQRRANLGM